MNLGELAGALRDRGCAIELRGEPGTPLSGVAEDSRTVGAGDLFLALPGTQSHGNSFIPAAREAGAAAVLCNPDGVAAAAGVPCIETQAVHEAAGNAAALLTGNGAASMAVVGVTGTNGKTSCTYLLEEMWRRCGRAAGVIGTVAVRYPGHELSAAMTTPAMVDLHRILGDMAAAGTTHVAMEVSSHALSQERIAGIELSAGIFTNLTRDHLDYHGDEESYFAAKASMFERYVASDGGCVVNADDPWSARLIERLPGREIIRVSAEGADADVSLKVVGNEISGMVIEARLRDAPPVTLRTRLLGEPNASNIASVLGTALALGLDPGEVFAAISEARPVPGRLERVGEGQPAVLVDYAHTPDALERTLATVRRFTPGRLIAVFGCGGDRDRGKRPLMGEAAARLADVAVVTSDNPRTEPMEAIIDEIAAGMSGEPADAADLSRADAAGYCRIADRGAAIEAAIGIAQAGDVVLVAGKGHEDYQEIDGVKHAFDDREAVRRVLGRGTQS